MRHSPFDDETGLSIRRPAVKPIQEADPAANPGSAIATPPGRWQLRSARVSIIWESDGCLTTAQCPKCHRASGLLVAATATSVTGPPFYRPDQLALARLRPRTMPQKTRVGLNQSHRPSSLKQCQVGKTRSVRPISQFPGRGACIFWFPLRLHHLIRLTAQQRAALKPDLFSNKIVHPGLHLTTPDSAVSSQAFDEPGRLYRRIYVSHLHF